MTTVERLRMMAAMARSTECFVPTREAWAEVAELAADLIEEVERLGGDTAAVDKFLTEGENPKAEDDTVHDVRHDPSTTGHDRWTCFADDCDQSISSTCLRAPYMSQATWEGRLAAFFNEHEYTPPEGLEAAAT